MAYIQKGEEKQMMQTWLSGAMAQLQTAKTLQEASDIINYFSQGVQNNYNGAWIKPEHSQISQLTDAWQLAKKRINDESEQRGGLTEDQYKTQQLEKEDYLQRIKQFGPTEFDKVGKFGSTKSEFNSAVNEFQTNKNASDAAYANDKALLAKNPANFSGSAARENLNHARDIANTEMLKVNSLVSPEGSAGNMKYNVNNDAAQLAKKYGLVKDGMFNIDELKNVIQSKLTSIENGTSSESKAVQAKADVAQPQPNISSASETSAGVSGNAPVSEFEKTPEMQKYEDIINARLVKAPEFTPEMVTQWQAKLNETQAPFEQQAAEKLRTEFSAASPLSYGSGNQMEATRELIREQEANKASQALTLGQNDYANQKSDYENALNQSLALQQYYTAAKNMKTDQERQDYWAQTQRQWGLEDTSSARKFATETAATARSQQLEDQKTQDTQYWQRLMASQDFALDQQEQADKKQMQLLLTQRGWNLADALTARNQALQDYQMQKQDYADIAAANKPADVPWWQQLLTPALQGVGTGIGMGTSYGIANKIMGSSFFGDKTNTVPNPAKNYFTNPNDVMKWPV